MIAMRPMIRVILALLASASLAAPPSTQPVATPANRVLAALPSGANVAVIQIDGLIYDFTLESLKSRVDRAVKGGASLIVLEINTNGGLATSTLDISRYVKTIPVPTVAWVNDKAYSAGAIIAVACNAVIMSPASAIGDCAPIVPGENLLPTERAKRLAPLLAELRDSANRNGYDYALLHATCELGVEVYEIENPATGQRRVVDQDTYKTLVQGVEALGPDQASLNAERGAWRLVRQVHDGKPLLTLNQTEAIAIGLARGTVRNQTELKQFLAASSVTTVEFPWIETAAYWLSRLWVRAILLTILLLGGYIEAHAPGHGVGALIVIAAMLLLLIAPFLVGLAQVWQLLLFLLGLAILLIEIFAVPTFGMLGIVGIIFMFVGLVLAVVPTSGGGPISLPPPEMWRRVQESALWMMVGVLFSGTGFYFITKHFGRLPLMNRLVLHTPSLQPAGGEPMTVSGDEALGGGRIAVGAAGSSVSHLRPSGRALIDGMVVDVVTLGSWIEPGARIRVVEVAGNRIVVERGA